MTATPDETIEQPQRTEESEPRETGLHTGAPDVLRAAASERRRTEDETPRDVTPDHWVTD